MYNIQLRKSFTTPKTWLHDSMLRTIKKGTKGPRYCYLSSMDFLELFKKQ
jgi:hypothetical protein